MIFGELVSAAELVEVEPDLVAPSTEHPHRAARVDRHRDAVVVIDGGDAADGRGPAHALRTRDDLVHGVAVPSHVQSALHAARGRFRDDRFETSAWFDVLGDHEQRGLEGGRERRGDGLGGERRGLPLELVPSGRGMLDQVADRHPGSLEGRPRRVGRAPGHRCLTRARHLVARQRTRRDRFEQGYEPGGDVLFVIGQGVDPYTHHAVVGTQTLFPRERRVAETLFPSELVERAPPGDLDGDVERHLAARQQGAAHRRRWAVRVRGGHQVRRQLEGTRREPRPLGQGEPKSVRGRAGHPEHGVGAIEPLPAPRAYLIGRHARQPEFEPVDQPERAVAEPRRHRPAGAAARTEGLRSQDAPLDVQAVELQIREALARLPEEALGLLLGARDPQIGGEEPHRTVHVVVAGLEPLERQVLDEVRDTAQRE